MIQEKAHMLSMTYNHDDFLASNGWIFRFHQRHNIKSSVLSGESAGVLDSDVDLQIT